MTILAQAMSPVVRGALGREAPQGSPGEAEPLQSPEADSSGPALGPMGDRRLIRLYLVRKYVNIVLRRRLSIPDAPPMALAEVGWPAQRVD